jgi:fatty acid desaturase
MLDVGEEQRAARQQRARGFRFFWAIIFGVTVAALVVSRMTSELNGDSALSWLVHFWLFEFVFGVTVTLIATWGRDDGHTRARRERERRSPSPRYYV